MKLTPARRRALAVLAERHRHGRCARVSNTTDAEAGCLYWQSAEWLVAAGLAEPIGVEHGWPSNTYLRITPAGIVAAGEG